MNLRRNACIVLFFNILCSNIAAQYRAVPALELSLHGGIVWRHTPKLSTQTGEWLGMQEMGIRFQTLGRYAWQQLQHYPEAGVNVMHIRLGDGNHGHAFVLLPTLDVSLGRRKALAGWFRLGSGPAWVSRPYNYFNNPGQNAVGSHWNMAVQFRFGASYRLSPHVRLLAGAGLTHISNGGSELPNYGINLPTGYGGLEWSPKAVSPDAFRHDGLSRRATRRFGARLGTGLAFSEYNTFDGPKYLIHNVSAALMYYLNRCNRAGAGLDYERNDAVYAWGLHVAYFANKAEARRGATRLALFAADEFLFGPFGVQVQRGWYVGRDFNQLTLRRAYSKLHMRYYLPPIPRTPLRAHVGITLKAHAVIAEYIAFDTGLAF